MGLLELTSSHVILSSGCLGQNCTSVITNNHWLGGKIEKLKGTVCFIHTSFNNGCKDNSFRVQDETIYDVILIVGDKITVIMSMI